MKIRSCLSTLVVVVSISACGDDDNSNPATGTDEPLNDPSDSVVSREITTLEDYSNFIVGKTAVSSNPEDGSRDENSQVIAHDDGTVTGFGPNGTVLLNWYWEERYFCRSGVFELDGVSTPIELDCQTVSINDQIATFVGERGSSDEVSSWHISDTNEVETLEDFNDTIVGKTLILRNEDGSRDERTQYVVDTDGTITGFTPEGEALLDWYWEDDLFCRSGVVGIPDNATNVDLDCHELILYSNVVSLVRQEGTGERIYYFVE